MLRGLCWFVSMLGVTGCAEVVHVDLLAPALPSDAGGDHDDLDGGLEEERDAARDAQTLADADAGPIVRYTFEGRGEIVRDSVGEAHARCMGGAQLSGTGSLQLDGVDDYVDLPNGLLSRLRSATLVLWIEWGGGSCWQRVFDFGSSDEGEDRVGSATSSLFMTPAKCEEGQAMVELRVRDSQDTARAGGTLPRDRPVQLAVVIDSSRDRLSLFVDGTEVARTELRSGLRNLRDVNNWLGRSQWRKDRFARVRYEELRLYDRALEDEALRAMARRGPDAL